MALRRSPRLAPSGFSSGSISSSAPPSAPPSSSSSSPQTQEFPAGSDSASDFEVSLQPRKRGIPRGSSSSQLSKRSRLSGGNKNSQQNSQQNSLFEAVFSGKVAMETLVDEWLESYKKDKELAFLELLNFTVRSCGCRGVVSAEMLRELQNSQIIRKLTESFAEDSPEYPFSLHSRPWRRFQLGFSEFLAGIILRGRNSAVLDGFLLDSWIPFLTGLSDSQVRPFRHTGTLAALKVMTSLVEVALDVEKQQENSQRQLEAEKGKIPERRGTEKLELLLHKQSELRETQEELEGLMNGIFKGVFVHRYRDIVPEIRGICMEELGVWMRKFPKSFLSDSHLKYLGWTLHDKQGEVRLRCVRALRGIYGIPGMAASLELFTERFKPRLVAMAHDKEAEVALEVLKLLSDLDRTLEDCLSAEDCQSIFPVVFVGSRALAAAAGSFLFHRLLDPGKHGRGSEDSRTFLLLLVDFFLQSELHEHAAYLVDSLWDCAGKFLRDWERISELLLHETSLNLRQEKALVEFLSSSGLRVAQGKPPVGRTAGRKLSPRDRRELQEEKSRMSRSLIPVLPQLLQKFSAEADSAASLLQLLQHLELGMFRKGRWEKSLEQITSQILEIFGKHSEVFPALSAASGALRALSDPAFSLRGFGDMARSQLGDRLAQQCHLQVAEILQAEAPDDDDIYSLTVTLRRLEVLYSCHDVTPWALFAPCWRLLCHCRDSGELPAEVTIPAISCVFYHLLWELHKIPESGASEEKLQDFHSRVSSFLSLCQNFLNHLNPAVREKAFLALSDLLVLLGPGLPMEKIRISADAELQSQLAAALADLVFREENEQNSGDEEFGIEALQRRRLLLAGFCKLLLQGILEIPAAAEVFKYYCKFFGDYGDIIRETLRGTRELSRIQWAQTVLLSLKQLFSELLLQQGPEIRALPEFQEIRDLGRKFSQFFSLHQLRNRQALLQLHSEGIEFSLQPPQELEFGEFGEFGEFSALNLPFLEILSEFSPRLLSADRALLLSLLDRSCRQRRLGNSGNSGDLGNSGADLGDLGDFPALQVYRKSLEAPGSPRGAPAAKRARKWAPPPGSPWPPKPKLTSTLAKVKPKIGKSSVQLQSSSSRRSLGSRLSLMEEEEEEEEEENPKSPKSFPEQPEDLFGSSSF